MDASLFVAIVLVVAGLLAIGLSTTSLALVYQFLRGRKLLGDDAGQVILAAAMVVDVLSMASLAVLQEGGLDQRLFTAILLIVVLSAGLPMLLLRDLPSELDA